MKHDRCTKDSLGFFRGFSFNDVNVTLLPPTVPRNSNRYSSSMLRVLEQAFAVGHAPGDNVGTWPDGTPDHIKGGSLG